VIEGDIGYFQRFRPFPVRLRERTACYYFPVRFNLYGLRRAARLGLR
jgi:hypothetical protein